MLTNERLRFINDTTFQDAEPSKDGSRPLEWRRSFKAISFDVESPTVEHVYSINEIDHFAEFRSSKATTDGPENAVVTATGKRILRITFSIPQKQLRDTIFCTKETEDGSDLYLLRRIEGNVHVALTDADSTAQHGPFAQGAYAGLAFLTDSEFEDDGLSVEVSIPSQHLEEIARALKAREANALQATISLQSFSYEVDDALREWHHRRDLFIHGDAAPAALLSLRLLRRDTEQELLQTATDTADATVQITPHVPLLDYGPVLRGIRAALWVVAGTLLVQVVQRFASGA